MKQPLAQHQEHPLLEPGRVQPHVDAVARGGSYLAGGNLFALVARFLIGLMLARQLGPSGYGLYNLGISAAALFAGAASLGLDDAMLRFVAVFSGRRDTLRLRGTLQVGAVVGFASGSLLGVILYTAADPIAVGLFDEPGLAPLLRLFSVVVPFLTLSNVLLGVARGFGRMDYAAIGENVVQTVVRLVLIGLLSLGDLDLMEAGLVFGISDVAATVAFLLLLDRRFPLREWRRREAHREVSTIFRFALPLWLSGLLSQFRKNIEVFMLGSLAAATSVGIFGVVSQVTILVHVVYRSIVVSVKPSVARLHDARDRGGLEHLYATTTRWLLIASIPFFLAMTLYPEPILAIFGESFVAGSAALAVLAIAELVNAATGVCGSVIDMTGHTRVKLANSVAWVVLMVVGNALLVPRLGVLGAAIAVLIAMALVNLARVVEVWILERLLPFGPETWKPVAAGALAFGLGRLLLATLPVGTAFLPAFGQGLVVAAVFVGVLLALGVAPEDRVLAGRVWAKVTRRGRRLPTLPSNGRRRS